MADSQYPINGKRIFLTGGLGHIGLHVVDALLAENPAQITILDSGILSNLLFLPDSPKIKRIKAIIGKVDQATLSDQIRAHDYLIHLAAIKHQRSQNDPFSVIEENITGMQMLLEAAAEVGIKKVIFSSSLYTYGKWCAPAMTENDIPTPDTLYGMSKLAGENLLACMFKKHAIPYSVLRLFFVYGPRQYPGMGYKSVITKHFERIMANENPVVYGDGQQTLDYSYVEDVAKGIVQCLKSEKTNARIFNVSSGIGVSVLELTKKILKIAKMENRLSIDFAAPDHTDGTYRVGKNQLAKDAFRYSPSISLDEGLRRVYEWMKKR